MKGFKFENTYEIILIKNICVRAIYLSIYKNKQKYQSMEK